MRTKKEDTKVERRRQEIIQLLETAGGVTANDMMKRFGVCRGTILKDIATLRRKGYPIQVSSMTTQDGMYVAVYEIPRYRPARWSN